MGTQDETVRVKTDVTKGQGVAHSYCVNIGLGWPVGGKRIVMPVEHDNGVRGKDGRHGMGLRRSDAHGEKALPIATDNGAAGAEFLKDSGRKLNAFDRSLRSNTGGMHGGSVRDKRNGVKLVITRTGHWCNLARKLRRKEVFDTEHLRSQHAIDGDETEHAFAMEEVGNVRWLETGLPGKKSSREKPTIDSARYLKSKTLMDLGNIHLWNFVFELYTAIRAFAHRKAI